MQIEGPTGKHLDCPFCDGQFLSIGVWDGDLEYQDHEHLVFEVYECTSCVSRCKRGMPRTSWELERLKKGVT